MILQSTQIKGKGRGVMLGFPTINLVIPQELILDDGIYAVWVVINHTTYKGALHYGPIPTFNEQDKTLEVYLLDVTNETLPETRNVPIEVDVVERLRDVKNFAEVDDLSAAIARDVEKVHAILK